jgi:hypothetical protein
VIEGIWERRSRILPRSSNGRDWDLMSGAGARRTSGSAQQEAGADVSEVFPGMARDREALDRMYREIAQTLSDRVRGMAGDGIEDGLPKISEWSESVNEGEGMDWPAADDAPPNIGDTGMQYSLPAQKGDPGTARAGRLTADEVARVAYRAGFRGNALATMVAIAMGESSNNPRAHNPVGRDNSYGLWQINMLDRPGYMMGEERRRRWGISNEDLWDPDVNARAAYSLTAGGTKFTDWSVYTNGIFLQFWDVSSEAAARVEQEMGSAVRPERAR